MLSECCVCDRQATRYWGERPYCKQCLPDARAENPTAHSCPTCHKQQPPYVSWRGDECGVCKGRKR